MRSINLNRLIFAIMIFGTLSVFPAGCGHKAPPEWLEPEEFPAPTGIEAYYKFGGVSISWDYPDALQPYINGFVVERYRDGVLVSSPRGSNRYFQDNEAAGFSYRIAAIGRRKGIKAEFSPFIKPPVMEGLGPPDGLRAEMTLEGLRLQWGAVKGIETYNVYRDTRGSAHGEESLGGFVNSGSTVDPDPEMSGGAVLLYSVCAVRVVTSDGMRIIAEGPASAALEVDPAMFRPAAPTGVGITQSGGKVLVYWDISPEKWVEGYRVYRVDREGGLHHLADTVTPAYTEKVLDHTGYGYAVSAFGKSLEGSVSPTVWVKAPSSR